MSAEGRERAGEDGLSQIGHSLHTHVRDLGLTLNALGKPAGTLKQLGEVGRD